MSDTARVPCEGTVSKKVKSGRQSVWRDSRCGALSEPGVKHCTIHLTHLEKDWLRRQRNELAERQNTEHAFVASPTDPAICGWCHLAERAHGG